MKKPLLIVCVLGIVSWTMWQLAPHGPKSATSTRAEDARSIGQTELAPIGTSRPARTNQFHLSRHTSGPETTNLVWTNIHTSPDGVAIIEVRTQAVAVGWQPNPQTQPVVDLRERLKNEEGYKELFAKEAEWKEKAKTLKEGMTIQQVIAVMGEPTNRDDLPTERDGRLTFFTYSPPVRRSIFDPPSSMYSL